MPAWESWDAARNPECRIVAEADGEVLGCAGLSPVSQRPVYAGVREAMIYMGEFARGRGVGRRLLCRPVEETEKEGIWALQAGLFPENAASIRIFESAVFGFRERMSGSVGSTTGGGGTWC